MKKVLILVDLQNDFVSHGGALSNEYCEAIVDKAAKVIKNTDADLIICTKDTHINDEYLHTLEGQKLPVAHCIEDTGGHDLNPIILEALDSRQIPPKKEIPYKSYRKTTFGITGDNWSRILSENGIDVNMGTSFEIEILGVCTGICVIANAINLRSVFPNTKITIWKDCCACITPESHESALKILSLQQCEVKNYFHT